METTGAELIIHLLARQGIGIIAGIPGGANLPLYDALARTGNIRHVLARHEQGAGFIAQGMARSTGRPQVCFATSGPGATNMVTVLADALLDAIPLVCITGQVPTKMIGTRAFQEVDAGGMASPVTKRSYSIRKAEELLDIIPEAFQTAASGRPGPVLVDVPKDVQQQVVRLDQWPKPGRAAAPATVPPEALGTAVRMISTANRPVLYLGGGIRNERAASAALALAEKSSLPCVMTLMGLGVIPARHPLSLGMLGMHAARHTNMVLEECDLLIATAVRFDDRATGQLEQFCPGAGIIHINIDPSEMDRLRTAQLSLVGDAGDILTGLAAQIPRRNRFRWLNRIAELKACYPCRDSQYGAQISPKQLILGMAALLDRQAIIVTDVGQHQMWTAQTYPFERPGQLITSGGLGTMGFGLPAAIGASLANPHATVVCFSGDGSLMMNIQEMATAAEESVNVKIVLMNNNGLGLVQQQQRLFYQQRLFASTFSRPVDFVTIAKGFGIKTVDVSGRTDIHDALTCALNEPGPCLIHVPIDDRAMVYPMVPPGAANRQMIEREPVS